MSQANLHEGSWQLLTLLDQAPGLLQLAETLSELADEGHPIVAATADLKYSNGLVRFQERHPDRFVQFGVSEQHMVSAAAGMAAAGMRPHVATFASFLALLCCEQIRTDCAYTNLPVRLIGHHAGITLGFYGTSHHATEDLAVMRSIANLDVVAPADPVSLAGLIRGYADHDGPVYFRIGRGRDPQVYAPGEFRHQRGRAIVHGEGSDLTLIATGSMVHPGLEAMALLKEQGHSVGLIDMHTVKPIDADAIARAARSRHVMTVEEHNVLGGLGGAVAEELTSQGSDARLHRHGFRDEFSLIGPPTHLYRHYRLDGPGIATEAAAFLADPDLALAEPS